MRLLVIDSSCNTRHQLSEAFKVPLRGTGLALCPGLRIGLTEIDGRRCDRQVNEWQRTRVLNSVNIAISEPDDISGLNRPSLSAVQQQSASS